MKKFLFSLMSAVALFLGVSCSSGGDDTIPGSLPGNGGNSGTTLSVTFTPDGGDVDQGDVVTIKASDDDAVVYYATRKFDKTNYKTVAEKSSTAIAIYEVPSEDASYEFDLYAMAVKGASLSEVAKKSFNAVVKEVTGLPEAVTFTPSAEADETTKLFARGTTVALSSKCEDETDTIEIYYSTDSELDASNCTTAGTKYTAPVAVDDVLTLYAVAVNSKGASKVSSKTFDVPLAFAELSETVNYGFDGGIKPVLDAINGSSSAVTLDSVSVCGIITIVTSSYAIITDGNYGIQLYKSGVFNTTKYKTGDFISVSGCTKGLVYGTSGNAEITEFGDVTKDTSKATRNILYTKIKSYEVDFTPYLSVTTEGKGNGNLKLYGFRTQPNLHKTSPDFIYPDKSDVFTLDAVMANFGHVIITKDNLIEFSIDLQADKDVMVEDEWPVKNVAFSEVPGTVEAGTTISLTCETAGAEIYYSTEAFDAKDFDASDSAKFTKGNSVTITDDVAIYAIAVLDGKTSFAVTSAEYFTPFTTTYVELSETNNYDFDGGIAALRAIPILDTPTTSAIDVTLEPVTGIVAAIASGTGGANKFLLQDKNAGIYCYGITLPSTARVGSKISLKPTKIQNRYGGLQISGATDIEVVEAKASANIYYINLSGLTDFTAYKTTDQLCGLRGTKADYPKSQLTAYLASWNSSALALPVEEKAYFGYVYDYIYSSSGTTTITTELIALNIEDADVLSYPASYIKAPAMSVASGEVKAGTKVAISCSYPATAEVYYQFVAASDTTTAALTAENYLTAGTKYTEAVAINEAGKLSAVSVNGSFVSEVVSTEYTLSAANELSFSFNAATLGLENAADVTELTVDAANGTKISFTLGENTNNGCKYYSAGDAIRFYKKNTITFTSDKTITSVEFTYTGTSYKPTTDESKGMSATSGSYVIGSSTTDTWSGSAKTFTLTYESNGPTTRLASIKITYAE